MKDKSIAFYLRLSMADGDLGKDNKDESNSIENQRHLLQQYIEDREDLYGTVREYIDDGYTGTNFNRPGFKQMLKDAGKGEIDVILVKDLSRLGRDYIGVGDYVEQIFPMFKVRFIAVNNNYDSSSAVGTTMGLDFAVNNLINEMYSRDVSKKVRSTFEIMWKHGHATSFKVPFGYRWNKDSEKRWEIDPVSAGYVRKVFDYALKGNTTKQIAVKMNSEHIPTPGLYAKMTSKPGMGKMDMSPDSEKLWETGTVSGILRKYEYTGALIMRKMERFGLENASSHVAPKEDQIVVENAHDAIVTLEEFNRAQGVIRTVKSSSHKPGHEFPLKKIVRCGTCKRLMTNIVINGENVFRCEYTRKYGNFSSCCRATYKESDINNKVLHAIRQVIRMAKILDEMLKEQNGRKPLTPETPDPEKIREKIESLKAERIRQYEAYADRIISKDTYLAKKKELSDKIEKLENELQKAEDLLQKNKDLLAGIEEVAGAEKYIPQGTELTAEIAQRFVESVYIYDENKMEIVFKCEDIIKAAIDKYLAKDSLFSLRTFL